jgi:hypothetical protein
MATTISSEALRAAHERGQAAMRVQRPVTLKWGVNEVLAREGVSRVGVSMPMGEAVDAKECRFFVERPRLKVAMAIGTVFEVKQRPGEKWRLREFASGLSASDPVWTLVCVEEFS